MSGVMCQGKLSICPTPIGNLGDMTPRALDALRAADAVLCEDTRVTGKLLAAFDISKPLERLDENLVAQKAAHVVDRVLSGEHLAYCSDAGMPGVSDPGLRLIDKALDKGALVEVIPGATAVATAYVSSGFANPRFMFCGFFPRKDQARIQGLESVAHIDAVLVYYESPHRVAGALAAIAERFPYRRVAVCRELTKVHEEVVRGNTQNIAQEFAERDRAGSIKGEIVIVLDVPASEEREQDIAHTTQCAEARAAELVAQGEMSKRDIARTLTREFGLSRNDAYHMTQRMS